MKKLYPLLFVLFLISILSGQGWTSTYGGTERDEGHSVEQTMDGGYIITGFTESYGNGNSDVWLIKTNSEGTLESFKSFNNPSEISVEAFALFLIKLVKFV